MRLPIIITIIFLSSLLVACSTQVPLISDQPSGNSPSNKLNSIVIPNSYTSNYENSFSSSSGNRFTNYTYRVINESVISCEGQFEFSGIDTYSRPCNLSEDFMLMSDIEYNLANLTLDQSKKFENMICYYNISNPQGSPMTLFVCFNDDNNIVAYGGKGGYGGVRTLWHIDGYMPDKEWYSYN